MSYTRKDIQATVAAIRSRCDVAPEVGMVLGSGLSSLADEVQDATRIPYEDLPNWPQSTVQGHSGRLVIGELEGRSVVIQQGRAHTYEGYSAHEVSFPVRVMHELGVETLIVTNAAGGVNPDFEAGDLMLIVDHIGWMGLAGNNPLSGPNDDTWGPRFPDMTFAYDREYIDIVRAIATEQGLGLREGVYTWLSGPSFETPAEIRMFHRLGIDAVGMSTVPEVIVARHMGMRVLGISTITNVAPHHPDPHHETTHDEVIETGRVVVPRLIKLLRAFLQRLPQSG